jgi:hypothetical protein
LGKKVNINDQTSILTPTWYTVPLLNGATGTVEYSKVNGIVTVRTRGLAPSYPGNYQTILNMPIGYRSGVSLAFIVPSTSWAADAVIWALTVNSTGNFQLAVHNAGSSLSASTPCFFYIQYQAER